MFSSLRNRSSSRFSKRLMVLIISFGVAIMTIADFKVAYAADLTSAELPNAQSSVSFTAPDSTTTLILRDAGFGLGVGVATGVLFSLMSGGNFSQPNSMIRSEAFGTALVTGLIGGVVTGIWQAKKARAEKAAVEATKAASN